MYDIFAWKRLGFVTISLKFLQKIVPEMLFFFLYVHKIITTHTNPAKASGAWAI